jgi:Peptidase S24-like
MTRHTGDVEDTRLVGLDGLEMAALVGELAALVEELAGRGVAARFIARGGSMSPWIRDGDVVTVAPLESTEPAGPGDVAAFKRPGSGRLTVHRLVRRVGEGWEARGDRLGGTDGVVADDEILGIVTRVERRGREAFLPRGMAGLFLARLSRVVLDARRRLRTMARVGSDS